MYENKCYKVNLETAYDKAKMNHNAKITHSSTSVHNSTQGFTAKLKTTFYLWDGIMPFIKTWDAFSHLQI